MAIDFGFLSGLLGGAATGYGEYQQRADAERKLRIAEDKEDRLQANEIYKQITDLAEVDAEDEDVTLKRLRNPALDALAKQQEMENRRARFEQRRAMMAGLASQPGITKYYGDVRGLISPSRIAGPGFQMPSAEMDITALNTRVQEIVKRAEAAPAAAKAAVIAQGRKSLESVASPEFINANLAMPGTELMRVPSATVQPKPLERPEEFYAKYPEIKKGVGGERKLPTGAIQKVSPEGVVSYETPIVADYVGSEERLAKIEKTRADVDKIQRLLPGQVQALYDKSEAMRWANMYNKARALKADKIIDAQIQKMTRSGNDASNSLRRLGLMLAHQRGMIAIGQRQQAIDLQKSAAGRQQLQILDNRIKSYEDAYNSAKKDWGKAVAKGSSAERLAAKQSLDMYGRELDNLRSMRQGVVSQDDATIQGIIGSLMSDVEEADYSGMGMGGAQMGMGGMPMGMMGYGGFMPQPQPSPSVNVIIPGLGGLGGGQPAPQAGGRPVTTAKPSNLDILKRDFGIK